MIEEEKDAETTEEAAPEEEAVGSGQEAEAASDEAPAPEEEPAPAEEAPRRGVFISYRRSDEPGLAVRSQHVAAAN